LPAAGAGLVLILAACSGAGTATTSASASPSEAASQSAAESTAESAAESAAEGGSETVMLQDFAFSPSELTIPAGTTVTFMNMDTAPHTATNGSDGEADPDAAFDIQLAAGSGTGEYTFDEPGTYNVTCTIHPAMNMTITVE
jgi:plastocyanin